QKNYAEEDSYMKGTYQFCESSDLDQFHIIDQQISMDFHPRHGSIIPVTRKELQHLLTTYGAPKNYTHLPQNNPILEGYHADPEILYAEKTGKYYLYPTCDGYTGWRGEYFRVFSSESWEDRKAERTMLDRKKEMSWPERNAWAPAMIAKKVAKNKYCHNYYYTAAQKIGVA